MALNSEIRTKAINALSVSACLFLTLLFFGPFNLYIVNKQGFDFSFGQIGVYFLGLVIFLTIFLSAVLLRLTTSVYHAAISLLAAFSFLFWLQGNILIWQYGALDGGPINWNKYWIYGLADSSIWFAVILTALIKVQFFSRNVRMIAGALISMQIIFFVVTLVQSPGSLIGRKVCIPSEKSEFYFSESRNVILIVLDEFQSDIFNEIITKDDKYKDIFDGFTYFHNSLAPFNFTRLSIPAILTGQMYDNSIPETDFFTKAFLDCSVPKVLHDNDFEVDLFPWSNHEEGNLSVYWDKRVADNFVPERFLKNKEIKDEGASLLDLTLFRYTPHFLKRYIYNNDEWLFSYFIKDNGNKSNTHMMGVDIAREYFHDEIFANNARLNARIQAPSRVFKFYHLHLPHVPICVNENGQIDRSLKYNKQTYTGQAKAILKICRRFFDVLKDKGVYDNSLIIVVGDHGSGRSSDMFVDPVFDSYNSRLDKVSQGGSFQTDKARGYPLVLIKRVNARGGLKRSEAPVSLTDLPKTIMTELGISSHFPGVSMFEISQDFGRKRYYGAFRYAFHRDGFETPITRYVVNGPVWSNDSWDVDTVLYPKGEEQYFSRLFDIKRKN